MDSASSRALIEKKEEKKQEPEKIVSRLPKPLQRHVLSFLTNYNTDECKNRNGLYFNIFSRPSFFGDKALLASTAHKAAYQLAHRIKVNETLAFMQKYPSILQTLPFPIEIIDPCGRLITRKSILEILVALDEFDVTEAKAEAKPCALIPTLFSWFDKAKGPRSNHIKTQLQLQLNETSGPLHETATKERKARYLGEIEILINKVISCTEIVNNSYTVPFENLMDLEFIQDFIKNAFKPSHKDNGELGIVWDCWQLYLDFLDLLGTYIDNNTVQDKLRPNLGGWWARKAEVVVTAVYTAFMRRSQFCHLEVFAKGIGNVFVDHLPVRFDCSQGRPIILDGIGGSHFFGFYGDIWADAAGARAWTWMFAATSRCKAFVKQKQQHYTAYAATAASDESRLSNNVETRRSPSATAAGR